MIKLAKLKLRRDRIWELDYLRGILLILVTIDHIFIFLPFFIMPTNAAGALLTKIARDYISLAVRPYVQPLIIFLFSFLSGINCSLTKNSYSRAVSFGLLVAAFMLIHKLGTVVFPSLFRGQIVFNILAVLCISIFLWIPLAKFKVPKPAILILGIILVEVGLYFWLRLLITGSYFVLPDNLKVFALLIYSQQGLQLSIDNFEPLLPSLGFFLIGGVAGGALYRQKQTIVRHLPNRLLKPVIKFGQYSLIGYLAAPVIILGFFVILNALHII